MRLTKRRFVNWAGNQSCRPALVRSPASEADVVEIVRAAIAHGRRVRAVGSGHSFTGAALTDGAMLELSEMSGIDHLDPVSAQVEVRAGTSLAQLSRELSDAGWALPNLGDIAYQSVAGAIATGTHGTGAAVTGLAGFVRALTLVDGAGDVRRLSDPDEVSLAAVSLGALGVTTSVRLAVVPQFNLEALEMPMRLEEVLGRLEELKTDNDHFEFFWIPHTGWALTKRNNRTPAPRDPMSRWHSFRDKILLENMAFGALARLGHLRPSLIPRLATALPSSGSRRYVDSSHEVFASARWVKFKEMEYAVPAEACASVVSELTSLVETRGHLVSFPVEVRFAKGDDVALSTAHGRDSAYVAVHVYAKSDHRGYFSDVEALMRAHDGRPHWGKLHSRSAADLAPSYPRWSEFCALRDRLDPERTFGNEYLSAVFGP